MFGYRRQLSVEKATHQFIQHTATSADLHFKDWLQNFLQAMVSVSDIDIELARHRFNQHDTQLIHFCATCALEGLAIANVAPPDRAGEIYNQLYQSLQEPFSDRVQHLGPVVFSLMERMDRESKTGQNLPPHSATFWIMEQLQFHEDEQTEQLFSSPSFVVLAGQGLLTKNFGFWKKFFQNRSLA